MKTKPLILISLLAGLLGLSIASRADDIDIYAGLGGTSSTPNLMFVIDSTANADASFGTCSYDSMTFGDGLGGAPSNGSNTLGNEQCALVNIVKFLPVRSVTDPTTGVTDPDVALLNLGITSSDGVYFQLTPIDDKPYTGTFPGASGLTDRQAFIYAAKTIAKSPHLVDMGDEMQETWAYYTGGLGSTSVNGTNYNTAKGLISGTTYTGTNATTGCQKNYDVFLGATASSSHPNDLTTTGAINQLTAAVTLYENSQVAAGNMTQATANANITSLTTVISNGAQPDKYASGPASWAREWANFMYTQDVNTTSAAPGTQSIVTYSVSIGGGNVDMANFINDMSTFGGGKYFTAATYADIYNDILKILNEVQAVNSVFSSSSLPVSVNAQGTFLNQIYMGMFRPDSEAAPRWLGNLKQYNFIYDSTTKNLSLGDSLGNPAISSSGTGFISPNAISFWTCTDLTTSPYPNTWITGSTNPLTSAQIQTLKDNLQNCADPLPDGFWAKDASSKTAVALGFDLPDGERVERGGAAQQIRHTSLTASYSGVTLASGGTELSPRKIYTWCPSGSSCQTGTLPNGYLSSTANAFSVNNPGMTATQFGSQSQVNITSMSRDPTLATDNVVTVNTATTTGFSPGDTVTIANSSISDYNGSFTIACATNPCGTTFTFNLPNVYPPNTAVGTTPPTLSYTATKGSGAPMSVSTLARSGNTVTATFSSAHGFNNGDTVTIAGASPNDYNGSWVISTAGPTSTQFTFTLNEQPPTVAGSGTATITFKTNGSYGGNSCPCTASYPINVWNATSPSLPGVQRTLGSTTVTINVGTTIPTTGAAAVSSGNAVNLTGILDQYGASVPGYTGNFKISSVTSSSFTITLAGLTPVSPASGAITAASGTPFAITNLSRSGNTATAVAPGNSFINGDTVSIGGTAGPNESAYLGSYVISNVNSVTGAFDYTITTTPATPPTAISGATMTATRAGFTSTDYNNLINWVRGQDNAGDEQSLCPGGALNAISGKDYTLCPSPAVTIRPSVHGDVLHSRPTVINYGSYPVVISNTSDSGTTRTATTASASDVQTIKTQGGAVPVVTFANGQSCPVTITGSTTFTYLSSGCGNAGAQTANTGSKVIVFYGDNGGMFHAVNGNQTATLYGAGPGDELWSFIPKQFFPKLNRLRSNSPQLNLPTTPPGISPTPKGKDYFIDGAPGVYQVIDGNGNTTRAVLYLSMRRGGSFIYALDVTNPAAPYVMWYRDNAGAYPFYTNLGQTWSQPKVALVKGWCGSGVTCDATHPQTPVVIMGGGYDINEDNEPEIAADTQARSVYIMDGLTGNAVWKAVYTSGSSYCATTAATVCYVSGMDYSIPSDITLMDSDHDGFVDRLYAADTGGNIWRVDLQPKTGITPSNWRIHHFAALGCDSGPCSNPAKPTQRKFFYPPEIIPATKSHTYDAIVAGSGDREHPLNISTTTQSYNRIYLLEDPYSNITGTGFDASAMDVPGNGYPLTMTATTGNQGLFDATLNGWDGTKNGYYITLGAGEKVVNAPLAVAGYVYMGTNTPPSPSSTSCVNSLGTATGYQLAPFAGTFKTVQFDGGGLPPSPVAGVVNIIQDGVVKQVPFIIGGGNPNCIGGADCKSALGGQKPPITVATTRHRNYWYIKGK